MNAIFYLIKYAGVIECHLKVSASSEFFTPMSLKFRHSKETIVFSCKTESQRYFKIICENASDKNLKLTLF